jgi:hypothetical protein
MIQIGPEILQIFTNTNFLDFVRVMKYRASMRKNYDTNKYIFAFI